MDEMTPASREPADRSDQIRAAAPGPADDAPARTTDAGAGDGVTDVDAGGDADDNSVDDDDDAAADRPAKRKSQGSFLRELPVLMLVAFLLALLIKTFLVQAFYIPSGSMERTLLVGDRVLVNKLVYRFRDIHRGEVVVFNGLDSFVQDPDARVARRPESLPARVGHGLRSLVGLAQPGEKDFIKRVIGLPGDRVACCTDKRVTVNGVPLDESPYVFEDNVADIDEIVVPEGKLWVMGDHRSQSSDSRLYGFVPINRVIGRAFVVVWPVSRAKGLRVPSTFDTKPSAAERGRAVATSPLAGGLLVATPLMAVRRRRRARRTALSV